MALETPAKTELVRDLLGRPLASLRVSVIDRCDLRCQYCMPEEHYTWLPSKDILNAAEIERVVDAFCQVGVRSIRLTGGEPLLRADLPALVARLAALPLVEDLAMTTNATRLARWAEPLRAAGLQRITVSLDSLDPARFTALTRRSTHAKALEGIRAAATTGFDALKLNVVVMRDFNDDELVDLLEFGREVGAEVRFIEYMDVGGATQWSMQKVVSQAEILGAADSSLRADPDRGRARFRARSALPLERRDALWHCRVGLRAVLRSLRPQSADGRRAVVHVSVRAARHRPKALVARRSGPGAAREAY